MLIQRTFWAAYGHNAGGKGEKDLSKGCWNPKRKLW